MQYYPHHVWKFQNNSLCIMQNTANLIWKGQNRKSQKSNLGSILCFSKVILISFVMLNNKTTSSFGIKMHEIHGASDFRPQNDYGISL